MSTQPAWVPGDTFGSRLILIRRELGLGVEEVAELCGLKHQTWSTWERGAAPRGMNVVVAKIALATGVDRDWLMWGGPLRGTLDRPSGGPGVTPGSGANLGEDTDIASTRYLWSMKYASDQGSSPALRRAA